MKQKKEENEMDWKEWTKAALIRAIRTFFQTFAGYITVGVAFHEIDWKVALSVSGVAFVYSIMTALGGLPEVEKKPPDAE